MRRVREVLGVSATFRAGRIIVEGEDDAVERAIAAFTEMRSVVESVEYITDSDVERILDALIMHNDTKAAASKPVVVGPKSEVRTRTTGQAHYIKQMQKNDLVFCSGPAGTGKTYLAVAQALSLLNAGKVNRISLARPAVEAGERLGFLPGDERQKVHPYLKPLYDAIADMIGYTQLGNLMEQGVIEIAPLAYMRGRTLSHSFVILDEAQNTTMSQMLMLLTRLGLGSKAVVTGDVTQIDLDDPSISGLIEATHTLDGVDGIGIVHLSEQDIVRHPLVRSIVAAYKRARG